MYALPTEHTTTAPTSVSQDSHKHRGTHPSALITPFSLAYLLFGAMGEQLLIENRFSVLSCVLFLECDAPHGRIRFL
jgi:hypothetical protein